MKPGDHVLLTGNGSPEWAAALLGIIATGAVVVPLDETSPAAFGLKVATKVAARAAIVPEARAHELATAAPVVVTLEAVRAMRTASGPFPTPHAAAPNDTAEIVFTSGTTSEPKGVVLSHANLLAGLTGVEEGFRAREWWLRPILPLKIFCLVPLSHLFGQTVGVFVPILMRSTSIYCSTLQPGRILHEIRREHPLIVVAVPRTLQGLAESARREMTRNGTAERFEKGFAAAEGYGGRIGSLGWLRRIFATRALRSVTGWRTWGFVVGGAALDPDVEEFWSRTGYFVIQGYGMTEAAPIIAIHNPLEGAARSIGRGVGSQEIRLGDDGEILVRGPNIMKGYYGDPAATGEMLKDGWLHTGDLGAMDDEGRLFFKGRKKEVIVTADGMNIFPSDVEAVLRNVPGVKSAVVFSLPGAKGEDVHGAVLGDGELPDGEAVRQAANAVLLGHQKLKGVFVWPHADFPRTHTGKVRRRDVAAVAMALRASAEKGAPPPVAGTVSRVAAAIARLRAASAAGPDAMPVAGEQRLVEDLGLGSLEMVELIGLLEEENDVVLDDRQVRSSLTVGDLDKLVAGGSEDPLRLTMPRWTRRRPFRWFRALARPLFLMPIYRLVVRLEVVGRERLAGATGPYIVVANHQSALDAPAILAALPRKLRGRLAPAMAIEVLPEHFEPEGKPLWRRLRSSFFYNLILLFFNAYPLPQSRGYRPSLEYTGEMLDLGFSPLIFPEGERTLDGKIHRFKRGIGLLAVETRAWMIPVKLVGLDVIMHREARWPKPGRAKVIVGAPFDPLAGGSVVPDDVAARIEAKVREL